MLTWYVPQNARSTDVVEDGCAIALGAVVPTWGVVPAWAEWSRSRFFDLSFFELRRTFNICLILKTHTIFEKIRKSAHSKNRFNHKFCGKLDPKTCPKILVLFEKEEILFEHISSFNYQNKRIKITTAQLHRICPAYRNYLTSMTQRHSPRRWTCEHIIPCKYI